MNNKQNHDITDILEQWQAGDESAAMRLFPLVYEELKRQARKYLSQERSNHTLQPTALVHEAFLRLANHSPLTASNRIHFFGIASRVMRQVLIDYARHHKAEKRGGAGEDYSIESIELIPGKPNADLLELDAALEKLKGIDERKSSVVDMRFFGGLKEKEIAEVLGVTEKTVRRDWQFAKVWLYRELTQTI